MSEPTLNFVHCPDLDFDFVPGHKMAYWSHGPVDAPHTIVCAHGLTRQGRDFDALAKALLRRAKAKDQVVRVVCPDVVGRGQSDWFTNPLHYQVPNYAADMNALLNQVKADGATTIDWVGTSMGGLIGMAVCGNPAMQDAHGVRKLVLNDVGPQIEWEAISRIGQYIGTHMRHASLQAAADAMWKISQGFGPHTDEQWLALSEHMVKPHEDGGVVLHYDPEIATAFKGATQASTVQGTAALWQLYNNINCPTLLVRGADSDLLSEATAKLMTERGPKAKLKEFAGVGHAPTFVASDQKDCVCDFLIGD
jgi:pimeloyl-ACP methyl ester carboxylesterase